MEVLILFGVVVLLWLIIRSRKKKGSTEIPIKVTMETRVGGHRYDPDRLVDTGKIKTIEDGLYCINPKSPFPLSFKNISDSNVQELKKLLDGESQWERNISEITFLIAQHNIVCIELDEFVTNAKNEISKSIKQQTTNSKEWGTSSEKDKADLLHEFQTTAIEKLNTKPSNQRAFETLLFSAPGDVTVDDKLLEYFSGNEELYRFYVSNLGRSTKANKIPADDYNRKNWESLSELGLAKRGKEIPVKVLLETLRMKDINEFLADRLDKKLTRKAQAIEFAESQPDILDVLSNHISFREMFQVAEPKGIEISEIKKCYEYATSQAEIIRDTYRTGYQTLSALEDAKDSEYDGWEIEAEDCCNSCSKLNGKKTKRKPSKQPPFHIGCTCSLEGTYED